MGSEREPAPHQQVDQHFPAADLIDPVTQYLQQFVDLSLLDENLKLSPAQRVDKMLATIRNVQEFRKAGEALQHK